MSKKLTVWLLIPTLLLGSISFGACAQTDEEAAEYQPAAVREPQEPAEPGVESIEEHQAPDATPAETGKEAEEAAVNHQPAKEEEVVIIRPPPTAIAKYKGLWLPFLREVEIALDEIDRLKADGVNTVAIGIRIHRDGQAIKDENEAEIRKAVNEFHKNGIRTCLMLNPAHPEFGISPFSPEACGKPLLDKVTPLALKWAGIAEQYGVEIFCPVNEPQLLSYQNDNDISEWAQEILPELRAVYHGKLAFLVQGGAEGLPAYNITGYDYVAIGGITADSDIDSIPHRTEEKINESLDAIEVAYPGQKCLYFGIAAFTGPDFYWWEPIAPANMSGNNPDLPADFFVVSREGQANYYQVLFQKTWEEVDGYFIGAYKGCEYRDKPAEDIIREWYTNDK